MPRIVCLLFSCLVCACSQDPVRRHSPSGDSGPAPAPAFTASFSATPTRGVAPLEVSVDASASTSPHGAITAYAWDFGDGASGAGVTASHTYDSAGTFRVRLTATDAAGNLGRAADLVFATAAVALPPDPASVAPELDRTVATNLYEATRFLYEGPNPIQTGVNPGAIHPERAAVIRAQVRDMGGGEVSGVRVRVRGAPGLGQTLSRDDGMSDLVVNGGGRVDLVFDKSGFLPVHRRVATDRLDYAHSPDVVMTPLDAAATVIDPTRNMDVARSTPVSDADGTRRAALMVPRGTGAEMELADGSTRPLESLTLRATEFTVGDRGPDAMPAMLPPTSAYTFCAELTADEALAQGAVGVRFDQPLVHYQENFLGFPTGGIVPVGYYDREAGEWVASKNGRVIEILAVAGNTVELDVDGSGEPATQAQLDGLGVTPDELTRLAELYQAGQSLWRTEVTHFTPYDHNWPYGPPDDARGPNGRRGKNSNNCDPPRPIVEFQDQVLGETIPVVGTPFSLSYRSNRVLGSEAGYTLEVQLTDNDPPASLEGVVLEVAVAGQIHRQSFDAAPNLTTDFVWDGLDAYGRRVQGSQPALVGVGWVYEMIYQEPAEQDEAFGRFGGAKIDAAGGRTDMTVWQRWEDRVGPWDSKALGFGGWSLDIHHAYDPFSKTIFMGDGTTRRSEDYALLIDGVAGYGSDSGDGGPAMDADLDYIYDMEVGPDGSLYILDINDGRIRVVTPDGKIGTVAGNGSSDTTGDGGPASDAGLGAAVGMALGPDGSMYIADQGALIIRKIGPDGIIDTIAGTGADPCVLCERPDGLPATEVDLLMPSDVAVGPDGSIYVPEMFNASLSKIDASGRFYRVMDFPHQRLTFGPEGAIYTIGDCTIERIELDGRLTVLAGTGNSPPDGFADEGTLAVQTPILPGHLSIAADGVVFFSEPTFHRIRRVGADGIITTMAGSGVFGQTGDGGPARLADLAIITSVVAAERGLYVADIDRIREITSPFSSFGQLGDVSIASTDGRQVYHFSATGRHLQTLDALTGNPIYVFGYDGDGLLTSITDRSDNVTTIERSGNGVADAIVAPFGQRTDLTADAAGYLQTVTNPASEAYQMAYDAGGLMVSFSVPSGDTYSYTYDDHGRLETYLDPGASAPSTLARVSAGDATTVTHSTPTGLETSYSTETTANGSVRQVRSDPSGGVTEMVLAPDGARVVTQPDGTVVTQAFTGDPRFDLQTPVPAAMSETTPAGLVRATAVTREAALADPFDWTTLETLTDTIAVNDAAATVAYTAADRTTVKTTPAGHTVTSVRDARGRLASLLLSPALDPILLTYRADGRVQSHAWGTSSWSYTYDSAGRVETRTDAAGGQASFGYDAADRVVSVETPAGRSYGFGYDADGNRTSVTMPSGAVHELLYAVPDKRAGHVPPGGAGSVRAFNDDRAPVTFTLPSGRVIESLYANGSLVSHIYPEAAVDYGYGAGSGCCGSAERLTTLTRTPAGGGLAQVVNYGYDGRLTTSIEFAGDANGSYAFRYDDDFRPVGVAFNGGLEEELTWDADGKLTASGPFALTREGPAGSVSAIHDSALGREQTYDRQGRVDGRTVVVNGQPIYAMALTYSNVGRLQQKVETIAGTTHTYVYAYDPDGWLVSVTRDGAPVETYDYDDNGNRTLPAATYDAQDRLTDHAGVTYVFDTDGFLAARGSDTFVYSARGELLEATVSGLTVRHAYDGLGRRVATTDATGTRVYLYGNPAAPFQVTASSDPSGTWSHYVYDDDGHLVAFERNGSWYYIGADQVGSPRVVADASGAVIEVVEYDAYGVLLSDSNPGFEVEVGYAGGLVGRDGMVRFGVRDYDPGTGRWCARDPLLFNGGQANLYAYAGNNPVHQRDPTGMWCLGGGIGVGVYVGGRVCCTWDGCQACGEVGVGVGVGASFDPGGSPGASGLSLEAAAGVSAGPVGVGVQGSISECGAKFGLTGGIGTGSGVSASAKITVTGCN